MVKEPEISIVIPLYGSFNLERILISIQSNTFQEEVNYEIIVSEQGESKKFPEINGVKHIFKYHKPKPNLSDFNPGNVRNEAIAIARGEFIYTNDADIVFLEHYYLVKSLEILKENSNKVLYRPLMRRLHLDEFHEFNERVNKQGIKKTIDLLNVSQKYIATLYKKQRGIRVFRKESVYLKTFTAFEEDYQNYFKNNLNKGNEPMFWNENRHCGGNLFRMEQFRGVGGYSEEFINWGCEDSDIQWKFYEKYDLQFFPEKLEVLRLDHQKEYFNSEMWKKNEAICERR